VELQTEEKHNGDGRTERKVGEDIGKFKDENKFNVPW